MPPSQSAFVRAARVRGAGRLLLLLLVVVVAACGPRPAPKPARWELMAGELAQQWGSAGISSGGEVRLDAPTGVLRVAAGEPMTGARFTGDWLALGLPLTRYRLTFEARRVEGQDFFATATFPVGALDRCVSLVIGGWGGGLVGISSIDDQDASENSTRGERRFENGRWYRVRVEVREEDLQVWIDDAPMVNVSIRGRRLGLRSGEIDRCVPLGFATWRTVGEVRQVVVEPLRR